MPLRPRFGPMSVALLASLLCLGFCALPAAAQNLVINPTFDDDVDGWIGVPSVVHTTEDGFRDPGAARVVGQSGPNLARVFQCLALEGTVAGPFAIFAAAKADGYQAQSLRLLIQVHGGTSGCDSQFPTVLFDQTLQAPQQDTWEVVGGDASGDVDGSLAIFVTLQADMVVPSAVSLFDDVIVLPTTILVDGFESGDVSEWSGTS